MDSLIKHMVDRFLGWRLPENFNPDCGIQFDADAAKKLDPRNLRYEPVGTNLFDATQAEAMVRHMLEGAGVDKMLAEAEQASEWRMDIRKQVAQADAVAKHQKERADGLEAEVNSLRGQLFEALLNAERMRGYMDAVEDGKPPAMVPAQAERHFGRYTGRGPEEHGYSASSFDGYGRTPPKRWFDR